MLTVYETLERPLVPILADMERAGIKVDARAAAPALGRVRPAHGAARGARPTSSPASRFNVGSPKQLGEVLFDELKLRRRPGAQDQDRRLRHRRRGARGAGGGQGHELPRVDPRLAPAAEAETHLHRRAGRAGQPGDRPRPHLLRHGRHLDRPAVLDRSQPAEHPDPHRGGPQDPRGLRRRARATSWCRPTTRRSSCASWPTWPTSPRSRRPSPTDSDIHAVTASQMFGVPVDRGRTGDLRRSAKTINFGIVYGIGAFGLAQRLGIPQGEAQGLHRGLLRAVSRHPRLHGATKAEAREQGYVTTLFGRRCYIPDINIKMPSRRAYAERAGDQRPDPGHAPPTSSSAPWSARWRALERELPGRACCSRSTTSWCSRCRRPRSRRPRALVQRVMEGAAHALRAAGGRGRARAELGAGALGRPERARSPLAGDDQALAASILSVKLRRAHSNLMENYFRTGRGISPCPTLYS